MDDGGVDAGPPLPLAVVGPPQTVAPNAIVTLNGMASTGDFPLSYGWTQIAGPAVSLSQNNSVTAHSPIFRALVDAGTVLEFALVVTDRYNRLSVNPAVARVNVGSVPVARFVPDGGLVLGGTTLAVQSTSFDDGGLVLVNHDWRLGTGSAATLVADGGRTAWVTFDAVPFGAPDRLASVELSVTNAIGATSPVTSRVFTVRGANPDNWAIDAGPNTPITVGLTPPTVNLRGSFTTTVPAPTPAWSWSCVPPVALLNPDTLTPSFVAPAVQGPPLLVTCTLTGTAQPPLNPAQLSAAVQVQLLDGADPQLAAVQPGDVTRSGPFGFSVRFDEPLSSASSLVVPCSPLQGWTPQVNGPHVLFAPTTELDEGASCTSASLRPSDTAGNAWTSDLRVRNGFIIRTEWEGPFVSSTSFANPRPVVATLGTYSTWAQQAANVPSPRPSPVELLVIEDGGLWRFPAFDPLVVDAGCGPGCVLSASPTGLAGLPEEPPAGRRAFWAQASMYVVTSLDGGVATLVERSPTGLFSVAPPPPGAPMQGSAGLRALTVDGGQLQGWFLDGSSWRQVETIANGLGAPNELVGFQDFVTGTFGPTSQFTTWTRNTTSWTTRTPTSQPAAAASNLNLFTFAGLYGVVYTNPSGVLRQYRLDGQATGFDFANSTTPVQGFDVATRGGVQITVLSENGNVRLHTFRAGSWAGSGVSYQVFPGPPRVGFTPPYPAVLDLDPSCEAAWPRLAFVEDALVVTWQERCVPEVRWRVVARIIR